MSRLAPPVQILAPCIGTPAGADAKYLGTAVDTADLAHRQSCQVVDKVANSAGCAYSKAANVQTTHRAVVPNLRKFLAPAAAALLCDAAAFA